MIDHFKASGNLVRMLGEQLVSNKFVALLELIKNAYDADARSVKIEFEKLQHPLTNEKVEAVTVSDSGHGITSGDISKRWLVLGTAEKEKLRFSPGGRRMLGAKGIGRFAIQRLGDFCRVSTVPNPAEFTLPDVSRGKSIKYTFDIDWIKATDPTRILEEYDLNIGDSSASASEHGTTLTVYQLRDEWAKDDIDRLQREISSLLPPAFSDEFKIIFSHWKFVPTTEQLTSSVLEYATYSIKGRASGKKRVQFEERGKKGSFESDTSLCGPFSFEIYAYDESHITDDYRGKTSKIMAAVDEFHGIKVYRDGFRVKPYGDRGTDWLGLDKYRVKLFNRFGSDRTIGVVHITSDKNPDMIDQTNREGIIEGAALAQFKQVLFALVNRLSIKNAAWHKVHTTTATLKFVKAIDVRQHPPCDEIVSCQVEHLSYFVVASQSCDVAGVDHSSGVTCFIAKMITFCDLVNHTNLPFEWRDNKGNATIKNILLAEFLDASIGSPEGKSLKLLRDDQLKYPGALRAALQSWKPANHSNEQRLKSKLQNFLTDIAENKKGRTYYFPPEADHSIPEAFVDLSVLFPVAVADIHNAKAQRLATIANPYKEEFSQRIGERFSRVAVPVPIKGEKF